MYYYNIFVENISNTIGIRFVKYLSLCNTFTLTGKWYFGVCKLQSFYISYLCATATAREAWPDKRK